MTNERSTEKILKDLEKKIERLLSDVKNAKDNICERATEKVKDMKSAKDKIESKFKGFKTENKDKWKEVKNHLSGAGEEIKQAVQVAFKKKG